ncbi:MAG: PmoA family protein [Cyclobacteriaceae bacterium]
MKPIPKIVLLLFFLASSLHAQDFKVIHSEEGVLVSESGNKVFFYQKKPKSRQGKYERSGYIHPLYGMNGEILTEDFPEDHLHHRGIFWAWHQMKVGQEQIADSWDCEGFTWDVVQTTGDVKNGMATIRTEVLWRPENTIDGAANILKEKTTITAHASDEQYRIIDFDITLTSLIDDLSIGGSDDEKGYGGFSIRLNLPPDISFLSDVGPAIPKETAVQPSAWMDFSGTFDQEQLSGVTVFSHPENPGHPHPWILRSSGSMQNPVYPGRMPVALAKDSSWRLQYRVVVHSGGLSSKEIEALYKVYSSTRDIQ